MEFFPYDKISIQIHTMPGRGSAQPNCQENECDGVTLNRHKSI